MSAESDQPDDAQATEAETAPDDVAATDHAPAAQHPRVGDATAAFERGDFFATRHLLDKLDVSDPVAELTEADRAEIVRLRHGIGRDRVTMSTGITGAVTLIAIILYYVVM